MEEEIENIIDSADHCICIEASETELAIGFTDSRGFHVIRVRAECAQNYGILEYSISKD